MTSHRSVHAHWHPTDLLPPTAGAIAGVAIALNNLAEAPAASFSRQGLFVALAVSAIAGAIAFVFSRGLILRLMSRSAILSVPRQAAFARRQAATYLIFLLFTAGATGLRLPPLVFPAFLLSLFAALNAILIFSSAPELRTRVHSSPAAVAFLFFLSGVAALIYQVTWQRALFSCFGVNIESVTVIVTIFMFGLGIGSITGGFISRRADPRTLVKRFLLCELLVGAFGLISVPLIRTIGDLTASSSLPVTALIIFALLSFPTLLMGATLPLLVAYAHQQFLHVGRSVGLLYFVNTLGSALACYLTADVLFVLAGEQAATIVAACFNFVVSCSVYALLRLAPAATPAKKELAESPRIAVQESIQ